MEPITMLAAAVPSLIDLLKGAANKYLAPAAYKPINVSEYVQMQESDTARFKALNDAGGGAVTYPWVEAIVRLQRPSVAAVTLSVWAYCHIYGASNVDSVDNIASAVFFYLFGDRTLGYIKAKTT